MKNMASLLDQMSVEFIDTNLYRGEAVDVGLTHVFGGQVLGQAINAAVRSSDEARLPHSFHAYFLRPGDLDKKIIYEVDPIRDGSSFSTRRVVAKQSGEAIFSCSVSMHKHEEGFAHGPTLPEHVPSPESLPNDFDLMKKYVEMQPEGDFERVRDKYMIFDKDVVELRTPNPEKWMAPGNQEPRFGFWFRFRNVGDDPIIHRTMLSFMSDRGLIAVGLLPHNVAMKGKKVMMASLDHAMWFHGDMDLNKWIYYDIESPWAGNARCVAHGKFYSEDGALIASTAQEGLIRPLEKMVKTKRSIAG
jgi:acyl-CoA thioesterase-2